MSDRKQNRTENGTESLIDEQQAPVSDRLSAIRARLDAATTTGWWDASAVEALTPWSGDVASLVAHAPADIAWLLDELQQSYWDVDEAIRNGEDAADYWKQQFDSLRRQNKEMRP